MLVEKLLEGSAQAFFHDLSRTALKYFRAVEFHRRALDWPRNPKEDDDPPLAILEKSDSFSLAGAGRGLS